MALHDLTPQLRTRLSRVERTVGWFITMATLLLLVAFSYYLYNTAVRRGWFETKIEYSTGLNSAAGLVPGDQVRLMGFSVGDITAVIPNPPGDYYGVTVFFRVKPPYDGYIWLDSKVRAASDFLGSRYLEIMKGYEGAPTVIDTKGSNLKVLNRDAVTERLNVLKKQIAQTNTSFEEHAIFIEATNRLNADLKTNSAFYYTDLAHAKPFWVEPLDSPALTERIEALVNNVEGALPNILSLTNQVAAALTNASGAAFQAQATIAQVQPLISNLTVISSNLREPRGSLGAWLLSSNLNSQLEQTMLSADSTLKAAHSTLSSTDTNITALVESLGLSLNQLASITSNLNAQVQANTNILRNVSESVVHTDELVQGLKRHWLLRSAFKAKKPPAKAR